MFIKAKHRNRNLSERIVYFFKNKFTVMIIVKPRSKYVENKKRILLL